MVSRVRVYIPETGNTDCIETEFASDEAADFMSRVVVASPLVTKVERLTTRQEVVVLKGAPEKPKVDR